MDMQKRAKAFADDLEDSYGTRGHWGELISYLRSIAAQPEEPVAHLYRWLKIRANWSVLPVDGNDELAEWVCQFQSPYGMGSDAEDDLDAAISAAMRSSLYLPLDKP